MTDDAEDRQPAKAGRRRIALVLAALAVLLAVLVVPPLISINQYKSRITQLMTASLGRPVRLSSVEMRLLPWPGFVLTDLSVAEDPSYGAEPILHANTVIASIRLTSLWRGRIEISRISVDEASLNLVHASADSWNLDPLFSTAAARAGSAPGSASGSGPRSASARLPYLEATNSRINIKDGAEKLPFSLVNTDLSFWQEDSGEWRIRLRGQPARTDLSLDLGDTGILRLDASMRRAPALQRMPVHLDLDWREAQLGQLTRLIFGSDPGWRGDLTGELHLEGTPGAAQVTARLRATGVHRAEFAPAEPLDFDAKCGFIYHSSNRSLEKLVCDSPLGNGLVHLTGALPGQDNPPALSLELDRIPAAAALDLLRTVRSGLAPEIEARGTVSGKLAYVQRAAPPQALSRSERKDLAAQSSLTGSLTIEGFGLSGPGLSQPLQVPKLVLSPAAPTAVARSQGLSGTVAVPAGGATPLTISMRLALDGYQANVHGLAAIKWARDLAHLTSLPEAKALDDLAGDPIAVDLNVQGRWQPGGMIVADADPVDKLTGAVDVRNANWKADYLANHIEISQATLHLEHGQLRWDPVVFAYGPVKGTASVTFPTACPVQPCPTQFQLQFGDLDSSAVEAAFLGAHERDTLLSTLIAHLHPEQAPSWPELAGTVRADSLAVGPITLADPVVTVSIHRDRAEFSDLAAASLGGHVHASGTLRWAGTDQAKPAYTVEASFEKLNPGAVGQLLAESWSGGVFDADGKVDLSGFTDKDLAASASGAFHFDWHHGSIAGASAELRPVAISRELPLPPALARFDDWTADATIVNGTVTLGKNQVVGASRKQTVEGTLSFGDPPKVRFAVTKDTRTAKR